MRTSTLLFVAALIGLTPSSSSAQGLPAVFEAIRQGGGWAQIPITAGRGELKTPALPSAGLSLSGCVAIWHGHSGTFTLKVADTYGNGRLEARAGPSDGVPFTYDPGPMAQLDIVVEWSEPRDTTLNVWIGLNSRRVERDPCVHIYSEASGG